MTEPQETPDLEAPRERVVVRRRSRRYRRLRWRRRLMWGVAAFALITVVQIVWALFNIHGMVDKLKAAEAAAKAGDFASAQTLTNSAHTEATRATWGTWGPQFWLMEQIPWAGDNVQALDTMSADSEALTGAVADDVFSLQRQLAPKRIRPVNSVVNPGYFSSATGTAQSLADRMRPIQAAADAVPTGGLLPGLSGSWARFRGVVDDAGFAASLTSNVVRMMPDLLGVRGTRHYLVAFQNNAEFRTTGGIPGGFSELTVTNGHMSLGPKLTGADVGYLSSPVLPLTGEENALFTPIMGEYTMDVTMTPDFPRAAQLLGAFYSRKFGYRVDGVISVDPVVLSGILKGSGPVTLSDGTVLTSANAVQQLLNTTYLNNQTNYQSQENHFSAAAHDVFDALVHGRGDAGTALRGVFDGVNQGRAMVWFADPKQQAGLLEAPVTKQLTRAVTYRPDVGVYLNDATSTKLDYYVASTSSVTSQSCRSGQQVLKVTTTLVSYVPPGLPAYSPFFVGPLVTQTPGDLLISVFGYGPYGGSVVSSTYDGRRGSPKVATHDGHPVVARTVLLPRGGSLTLTFTFQTAKGATGDPILRATPTATSDGRGTVSRTSC